MPEQKEKFLAFLSYVHKDDKHDDGQLSNLRNALQDEVSAQTGQPFKIFQDIENITWGYEWEFRIKNVLAGSSLLLAIVTPSYLSSKQCRFEFEYFLKRESQLNRKLILPIIYIDTPSLNDKNDYIATEISKRQWIDWTELRFYSIKSKKVKKKLALLARQIRELLSEITSIEDNTIENEYLLPGAVIRKTVVKAVEGSGPTSSRYPTLYAPVASASEKTSSPKQITILLRPTDDHERNKRRLKILYSTLTSFKGHDKFSFHIFEGGKGTLIDFPHDTTRISAEMLVRLKKLMGEESWRIEEIDFQ